VYFDTRKGWDIYKAIKQKRQKDVFDVCKNFIRLQHLLKGRKLI